MKTTKQTTDHEELLLKAREEALHNAAKAAAMKAHGKILGMDTFSWIAPEVETLAKAIESFPFPIHWVVDNLLAEQILEGYPELTNNIQSLMIFNKTMVNINRERLNEMPNVVCVEDLSDCLTILKSMPKKKNVFLFTSSHNRFEIWDTFDEFITIHR